MTDWSKYPINHLCSKCNKEYPLTIEVNNAGATAVFANCPYCGEREQLWIRVPWYTEVIRAYEESLLSDSKRMDAVEMIKAARNAELDKNIYFDKDDKK